MENRYIYQYRDHLGNARVSFAKNSEGVLEVTDTNNYYPFGLNHIQGMLSSSKFGSYYSYKYNGKELQETGMYDYGARFYMPDLGRWGVVDPLAEKMPSWSPYSYSFNNPVRYIDPDGREPLDWYQNKKTGNYEWKDTNKEIKGYRYIGKSESIGASADGYDRMYYLHANGSATVKTGDSKTTIFHAEGGESLSMISGGTITTSQTSVSGLAVQGGITPATQSL